MDKLDPYEEGKNQFLSSMESAKQKYRGRSYEFAACDTKYQSRTWTWLVFQIPFPVDASRTLE